jgi:hypothetical protein
MVKVSFFTNALENLQKIPNEGDSEVKTRSSFISKYTEESNTSILRSVSVGDHPILSKSLSFYSKPLFESQRGLHTKVANLAFIL